MTMMSWKLLCCVLHFLFQSGLSLHFVEFRIPSPVVRHDDVRLECRFDLDDDVLYAVKWFKDHYEFYRYVPGDLPHKKQFHIRDVTVDMHNSTESVVVLSSVKLSNSGVYRCEVSADAPTFQTISKQGEMLVVAVPEEDPQISGGRPRYQVGDTVQVNCTSGRSRSTTNLTWTINGEVADPKFLIPHEYSISGEGFVTTILGLEFVVSHEHFERGDMKLKCVASIKGAYSRSSEESVKEISMMEIATKVQPPNYRKIFLHRVILEAIVFFLSAFR